MTDKDVAILVITCDKYSDLWPIFFELKRRKWGDCHFRTYLGTNEKATEEEAVTSICIGADVSWAENLKKMLDQIEESHVLCLLEDFFLDREIDNGRIEALVDLMGEKDYDCLRLEPMPGPFRLSNRKLKVGRLNPNAPYYVSTQPAIWKKSSLEKLLKTGYSAWDFEIKGSADAKEFGFSFAGTSDFVLHHLNGVQRGMYYKSTVEFLDREGIKYDSSQRGILDDMKLGTRASLAKYRFKEWVKKFLAEFGFNFN